MLRVLKKEKAATAMGLCSAYGIRSVIISTCWEFSDVIWSDGTSKPTEVGTSEPAQKRQKTNQSEIREKVSRLGSQPPCEIEMVYQTPTDFFGRAIAVKSTSTTNPKLAATKTMKEPYRVSYRFNEGNSAAVRKPVKLNSFLWQRGSIITAVCFVSNCIL